MKIVEFMKAMPIKAKYTSPKVLRLTKKKKG